MKNKKFISLLLSIILVLTTIVIPSKAATDEQNIFTVPALNNFSQGTILFSNTPVEGEEFVLSATIELAGAGKAGSIYNSSLLYYEWDRTANLGINSLTLLIPTTKEGVGGNEWLGSLTPNLLNDNNLQYFTYLKANNALDNWPATANSNASGWTDWKITVNKATDGVKSNTSNTKIIIPQNTTFITDCSHIYVNDSFKAIHTANGKYWWTTGSGHGEGVETPGSDKQVLFKIHEIDTTNKRILVGMYNKANKSAGQSGTGFFIFNYDISTEPRTLSLEKKLANGLPSGASAKDAVYEIRLNNATGTKIGEFKVNANGIGVPQNLASGYTTSGNDIKWEVSPGTSQTIYWKEITAPSWTQEGFSWNITNHNGTLTLNSTNKSGTISDTNDGTQKYYGYLILNKTAPTNRSPEGAVYAIYSDSAKTNKVAEFTIQSDGKGKVNSVTGTGMTKHNDYTIKVDVTDGDKTFYYKETKLPTTTYDDFQWGNLENPTTKITVSKTNTASAPAKIAAENKGTTLKFGYMYLLKIVSINGGGASTTNARTYKPTGATFDIYEGTKKVISGVTIQEVTDSAGGLYYVGKGGTITSSVGITENDDTTSNLRGWKVDITNGNRTFYARETKLPTTTYSGWKWANTVGNDTESVTVTTSNTGIGIKLEAINRIDTDTETRSILLEKTVNVSGKLSYAQGAEYKIYMGKDSSGTYIGKFTINNSGTGVPSDVQKNFSISGNSIQWTVQKGSAAQTIYWVETKAPTNTPEGYKWSPITGHEGTKTVNSTTPSVTIQDENKLEYLAYLTVNKSVSPANNNYKPTGAIYSVFDTEAKANAARDNHGSAGALLNFTIKEDGTSNVQKIDLGLNTSKDLWIVETKLPTTTYAGFTWKWDTTVIKATVKNSHTNASPLVISSTNTYDMTGYMTINKSISPANNAYKPTGAVYSVFDTEVKAQAALTSRSSTGALLNFTIKEDGTSDIKSIALGTSSSKDLWVVETKLPTTTYAGFTWKWDSEVRKVTVTNNHTSNAPANVSSVNQYDIEGNVTVHKSINPVNNSFKPTGAVYSAFETKEAAENAIKSHNSDGAVFNFTIKEDGTTDIYTVKLGTSTEKKLYIVETKLPTTTYANFEWIWDETVHIATVKNTHTKDNVLVMNTTNKYKLYTELSLNKVFTSNTNKPLVSSEGAIYRVYNENDTLIARFDINKAGKGIVKYVNDRYVEKISDTTIRVDVTSGAKEYTVKEEYLPNNEYEVNYSTGKSSTDISNLNKPYVKWTNKSGDISVTVEYNKPKTVIGENHSEEYGWLKVIKYVDPMYIEQNPQLYPEGKPLLDYKNFFYQMEP